jgi:hypothetical protein
VLHTDFWRDLHAARDNLAGDPFGEVAGQHGGNVPFFVVVVVFAGSDANMRHVLLFYHHSLGH